MACAFCPLAGGGWPPMSPGDYQRYVASWQGLDTDRDGWVSGQDCFPVFSQSGLPREALKAGVKPSRIACRFVAPSRERRLP
eukprot:scaffold304106_cov17-Prasinocladus_malaysianus.AAC.1